MKTKLLMLCTFFYLLQTNISKAQIFADFVSASFDVSNASNAISSDKTDYATLTTPIGVLDPSSLTLGFSQHGFASMVCSVTMQQDNGLLSADVLKTISVSVYNSKNNLIAHQTGFSLADAEVLNGTGNMFKINVRVGPKIHDIGFVKIEAASLLAVENKLRVYNAVLRFTCPPFPADSIISSYNVVNAANAISESKDDYAVLAPPLLLGHSNITLRFPDVNNKDVNVVFLFGQGNTLINASLLSHIGLAVLDKSGNVLVADTAFTTADIKLIGGGKFKITLRAPNGTANQIAAARVNFSGILNVLTTLNLYNVVVNSNIESAIKPTITPANATICNGETISLSAKTNKNTPVNWQWYYNNEKISGSVSANYSAAKAGNYFVTTEQDGCYGVATQVKIIQGSCSTLATAQDASLKLYPNPFTSYALLSLDKNLANSVIRITDKSGNLISTLNTENAAQIKLLQNASPGLYFISVTNQNGQVYTAKLMKQ